MAGDRKQNGLQVEEDRAWQEKFWTAQRVGWALMALLILAALFGATGKGGPLASTSIELGAGVLEYPRITRWQSAEQLSLRLDPAASGEVELTLSPAFVRLFSIEAIEPQPSQVKATPEGHRFTFETEGGGGGERIIAFNVRATKPALAQPVRAGLRSEPARNMAVTVLP